MTYQMMYSSKAVQPMSTQDLRGILDDAREGNVARGVTGVLVYADGVFLQILEGEESVLRELMSSIENDSRHGKVTVFHEAEAAEPAFASWRMAYLAPTRDEMAEWAGLEGTETIEHLLEHVHRDSDRVPGILVSIVEALAESGSAEPA